MVLGGSISICLHLCRTLSVFRSQARVRCRPQSFLRRQFYKCCFASGLRRLFSFLFQFLYFDDSSECRVHSIRSFSRWPPSPRPEVQCNEMCCLPARYFWPFYRWRVRSPSESVRVNIQKFFINDLTLPILKRLRTQTHSHSHPSSYSQGMIFPSRLIHVSSTITINTINRRAPHLYSNRAGRAQQAERVHRQRQRAQTARV